MEVTGEHSWAGVGSRVVRPMTPEQVAAEVNRRLDVITEGAQHGAWKSGEDEPSTAWKSSNPDVAGHALWCTAWDEGQWCCLDRIPVDNTPPGREQQREDRWRFRDWLERTLLDVLGEDRP
jgi:hypothetical protein